ncbi:hypothetical protein P7H19_01040 [Paenibacillus larvae]|nr:hypothetical protein [Paenibacillus larvae]
MKIISGLLKPTAGTVSIDGNEQSHSLNELSANIGFVPDHAVLYEYLTGMEYLRFVGKCFKFPQKIQMYILMKCYKNYIYFMKAIS